ncbi:MAG TPA: DUF4010 domain-containing protein [Candidatus Dormibacteraeota bacterium]|nr:DUF4010 domain-containing protein [Candidatus Dormibacteraeota bacterium]
MTETPLPYLPTLARLALALALGLLIGIERERRRKEAGLRTFGFVAVLGAVGALLGQAYALFGLGLIGVLVVLLNVETIRTGEGAEITTSAALLLTGYIGLLAGQGNALTPTALGVATAALLAWKEPLAGFSRALTDGELRSAIVLAILAFVVYPMLPQGSVDPWHLIDPRAAWVTVILIAALGFANYVLLKLYGARGIHLGAFLGGLVNSTVTVTDLSERAGAARHGTTDLTFRGIMLATGAMLIRNAVLLVLIAPATALAAAVPIALMTLAAIGVARFSRHWPTAQPVEPSASPAHSSPFSLQAALKFGAIFLALQVTGTLAQRTMGEAGFYAVSALGGMVSSATAVASAGNLAAASLLSPEVAAIGALIASATSALVNLPIVARVAENRVLTLRVAAALAIVIVAGGVGVAASFMW